jgi:SAM-dependent methyltransferase
MLKDTLQLAIRAVFRMTAAGLAKGPHVTRYYMYRHLSQYRAPRAQHLRALSISRSENLAVLLGFSNAQITDVAYPDTSILSLPFRDETFDAVVSDQVLEHVEGNPQAAVDEAFRVLKRGGLALHTTCFVNPVHEAPHDYWRFTPAALELLVSNRGKVLDVGGWGNPYVWVFNGLGLRFEAIPHSAWHPGHWIATKNDSNWPIVTWVLVQRT